MSLTIEERLTKLEKELKEANKKIQNLINYRNIKENEDDPFNGYF